MSVSPTIEVRNLRFETNERIPRYWHGGRRAVSIFFDNLSIFFPLGERFFIASVRAHRDRVSDPRLLEEVKAFVAQEGIHSREHIRYNAMLREHGYPIDAMEKRVERILTRATRRLLPRWRLAVTCGLEHFTALMGHFILNDPRLLEGAHPEMAALWRWHAAEENEHKAVAFDVYLAAGGNWFERCALMIPTTIIFWAKVIEHQARLMHQNGILFSVREWASLVDYLFFRPGGMFKLFLHYLEYYLPGFHPWDMDNKELLERWKSAYQAAPPA
ncbi:metal-dependent hydrolase [Polyangium aurulentum]|uniref:metal-dependent hydrolase n=1 Tax=Polyangium aurulentum TaxID=2567896 RepID=UPI0010AEBF66|nr:metal-dependent hydrolase [Polyangium aurulentum]UQA60632.1 metal-dependent hydrolase [Polyangium aurulentum]